MKRHAPVRGRSPRQKHPFGRPIGHVEVLLKEPGSFTQMKSMVSTIAAMIQCNLRDGALASWMLQGYSPFLTSAGVIALGCFVSPARRVYDST